MVTQGARAGTERNGTGPARAAEATGPTRAAKATGKDNRYACCYFLSLFLYFHIFFVLLFFFSGYFFSDKYNNTQAGHKKKASDRWDGVYTSGDSNVGRD